MKIFFMTGDGDVRPAPVDVRAPFGGPFLAARFRSPNHPATPAPGPTAGGPSA